MSTQSEARPNRHIRQSSVARLWSRFERATAEHQLRMRQLAVACGQLQDCVAVPSFDFPTPVGARLDRMDAYDADRRSRSLGIVTATLDALVGKWKRVPTKREIHENSRQFDAEEGRGVSLSVLYQNPECDELIRRAADALAEPASFVPSKIRRLGQRRLGEIVRDAEAVVAAARSELAAVNERIIQERTPSLEERSLEFRITWLRAAADLSKAEREAKLSAQRRSISSQV